MGGPPQEAGPTDKGRPVLVVVAGSGLAEVEAHHLSACDVMDPAAILAAVHPGEEPTLLIGEQRHAQLVRRQAAVLGDRDELRPLAVRVLPHGPLAIVSLAARSAGLWQDVDPGLFVHYVDTAARYALSATWTPSVGGLADPAPSLGQHLRSWQPGSSFVLIHHPIASVTAASAAPQALSWPGGVTARRSLLEVAGEPPGSVVDRVSRLAGATSVRTVIPAASAQGRFGTARAVEMCAIPDDVEELAGPVTVARCPSCHLLSPGWLCAFCKRSTAPVVIGGAE